MARLTAAKRRGMKRGEFALSGRRFPINDARHARAALSGATRALRAGNITSSEARKIRGKARAKLRKSGSRSRRR